ncbi:PREDICTED: protein FAM114A2-like, partial [Priapulus caudatus]|uniref:Protein FAM114A2-like n=1 Tax=Priapulus caudatus TaxID=37621 RepID=A0ABM1DR56_PRICU
MAETESETEFQSADEGSEDEATSEHSLGESKVPENLHNEATDPEVNNAKTGDAVSTEEGLKTDTASVYAKSTTGNNTEVQDVDHTLTQMGSCNITEDNSKLSSKEEEAEPSQFQTDATLTSKLDSGVKEETKAEHTEKEMSVLEKLSGVAQSESSQQPAARTGWGWGWGSSLLSTASTSVSTFTSQVGHGISAVLETVEHEMGAPSPEQLAQDSVAGTAEEATADMRIGDKKQRSEKPVEAAEEANEKTSRSSGKQKEQEQAAESKNEAKDHKSTGEEEEGGGGRGGGGGIFDMSKGLLGGIKLGISNIVENTVEVGLDALESVGKKTWHHLSSGDPGLRKKRELLTGGPKPNLSQVLREVKEQAEEEAKQNAEIAEASKGHFSYWFDEQQGLAHLEALEMLSNQSETRVQSSLNVLPAEQLPEFKGNLISLRDVFQIEDVDEDDGENEHDFDAALKALASDINIVKTSEKLLSGHVRVRQCLEQLGAEQETGAAKEGKFIHQEAMQSIGELTAVGMEAFHKMGELLLVEEEADLQRHLDRANAFNRLCMLMCTEVAVMASKFSQCLNTAADDAEEPELVTPFLTNVYLEASNSSTYLQDGFRLLLPVVQLAYLQGALQA